MYLSSNWLLSKLALIFVEFHRNIPLSVLLFIWYFTVFAQLPKVDEAVVLPGPVYMTNRGVYMTWPRITETGLTFTIALILGILLAIAAFFILRQRRAVTGKQTYYLPISLAILIGLPLIGWFLSSGQPLWLDIPEKSGFNFQGGLRLTPEFAGPFRGSNHLHGRLYRRGRARRYPGREQGSGRGCPCYRLERLPGTQPGGHAAGAAHHCAANDQPIPQSGKKLQSGAGDRLPGIIQRGQDCH